MSVSRFYADSRAHNAAVPADRQGDTCDCPLCRAGYDLNSPLTDAERIAAGLEPADPVGAFLTDCAVAPSAEAPREMFEAYEASISSGAARVAGDPAAAIFAPPADERRPMPRGPVQDESLFRDPDDVQVGLGGDLPLIDDVGGGP